MGDDVQMLEDGNPRALLKTVKDYKADILIAGGRNMYTALKARIPFLDINQEREFGYAGYDGMLELVKQLALTLESPVWKSVRAPAPWEEGGILDTSLEPTAGDLAEAAEETPSGFSSDVNSVQEAV